MLHRPAPQLIVTKDETEHLKIRNVKWTSLIIVELCAVDKYTLTLDARENEEKQKGITFINSTRGSAAD